jgi:hypothetical protein
MSLTGAERETIITLNDEDETAEIWTAQRPWITRLKKNPSALLLEKGKHNGSVWARFEVPKALAQRGSMFCFIHGLDPEARRAHMRRLNKLAVQSKRVRGRRRCPKCGARL